MKTVFLNTLEEFGCTDINDTLERFVNDEEFYRQTVYQMLRDSAFDELFIALENNDTGQAFILAHLLMGIIGNCGITPMYLIISCMVDDLRDGKTDRASYMQTVLNAKRYELMALIDNAENK